MVGNFKLIITDHYLSKSKVKGTPFVRIMLKPLENLVTKEICDANYSFPWDGYLTENTFDRTMDAIEKALGQSVTEAELASGAFVGREINGKLEEEANATTNKKYTKVRWINPIGGPAQKPDAFKPSPSESRLIADTLRGKMLARNSTKKKPVTTGRPVSTPVYQAPITDGPDFPVQEQSSDECPF